MDYAITALNAPGLYIHMYIPLDVNFNTSYINFIFIL